MSQQGQATTRLMRGGMRLATDTAVVVGLSLIQIWSSSLGLAGDMFWGGLLAAISIVLAFHIGKTLGARQRTAAT